MAEQVNRKLIKSHPYQITKMPDGRWQTYVKTSDMENRKILRARSEKDLTKLLVEFYRDASSQKHIDNLTVTEMYFKWLEEYKKPRTESENTLKRHGQHFKKYLEGTTLFKKPLKQVSKLELESFCNDLVKSHALSSKEYTNIKTIINGLFEYACDLDYIPRNPMNNVKITVKFRQIAKKSGKTQTFNSDELVLLEDYLSRWYEKTNDLSFLAVKLNLYLGLRISELSALKWKDIFDEGHLHIEREEVRNQTTNEVYVVSHTKTNTDRIILLVPKANDIIEMIRQNNNSSCDDEDYIFLRDGERLRSRQIEYVLEKFHEREKTENMKSSHKLRKTYASRLSSNGVPIDEVRVQLGHSNIQTTLGYIYNPLTEEETRNLIIKAL